jgi:hypothetical protein
MSSVARIDNYTNTMPVTFTEEQQQEHWAAFIRECRQKAWRAVCHVD